MQNTSFNQDLQITKYKKDLTEIEPTPRFDHNQDSIALNDIKTELEAQVQELTLDLNCKEYRLA